MLLEHVFSKEANKEGTDTIRDKNTLKLNRLIKIIHYILCDARKEEYKKINGIYI